MTVVRRNAFLLAAGLVFQSGMIQLAVALGTVTIVAVTGVEGILGLGPAVFLLAGAAVVGPAGRISDRVGRMPVIRTGFVLGTLGPLLTAAGWAAAGPRYFDRPLRRRLRRDLGAARLRPDVRRPAADPARPRRPLARRRAVHA